MDTYKTTIETWDKLAHLYQDNFMHLDLYNDTYDTFCKWVETAKANILEVACGPGNITQYLIQKRPNFQIDATDAAPNMIQLAKANNPSAHFFLMDCREMAQLTTKYHGIVCGFCFPYLAQQAVEKWINDAAFLLHEKGVLYLSTIEGEYAQSGYERNSKGDEMFVYYYTATYLQQILKEKGFEVMECIKKPFTKSDGTSSTHLIFIAKKKP